jgi:tRNA(Ile)-lysidine synthase
MQNEFIIQLSQLLPAHARNGFADLRLIVGVSGGVDSVVLLHLLHQANIDCVVAHVNFQLRGEESERDMAFVRDLCAKLDYTCQILRVDTLAYAQTKKLSIQVAARQLRYDFFEQLLQTHKANFVATAQHLNDSIETIIYNLAKGCGLRGLHGILPLQTNILRPLHYARKSDILAYATQIGLTYVEDSSNASDKYSRNYIRHHIVPALTQINPQLEPTFGENIARFRATEQLLDWTLSHLRDQYWLPTDTPQHKSILDIQKLRAHPCAALLCYEWLAPLGFSAAQCQNILDPKTQNNAFWLTEKYRADYYRGLLSIDLQGEYKQTKDKILSFANAQELQDYYAFPLPQTAAYPDLRIEISSAKDFILANMGDNTANNTAFFDLDKLLFPLTLRRVQQGDKFRPLGMKGKSKKISDFFKDVGLEVKKRTKAWLLVDANDDVIWIVGYRSSEIGKVDSLTMRMLVVRIAHY